MCTICIRFSYPPHVQLRGWRSYQSQLDSIGRSAAFQQVPSTQGSQLNSRIRPAKFFALWAEKDHNLATERIKSPNKFRLAGGFAAFGEPCRILRILACWNAGVKFSSNELMSILGCDWTTQMKPTQDPHLWRMSDCCAPSTGLLKGNARTELRWFP